MADYIYTMEIRLTPDQQRGVTLVQDIARAAGMNIYLTGGAVRDINQRFSHPRPRLLGPGQSPQTAKGPGEGRGADCRQR
jgi:hypothetical protein